MLSTPPGNDPLERDIATRAREAEKIYTAIFRRRPSEIVVTRFIAAIDRLETGANPEEVSICSGLLSDDVDIEAVEVAARYTGKLPLMTKKFQLMMHIAETLPEHQSCLVNLRWSRRRGLWSVFFGGLETTCKVTKGLYLLRKVK